MSGFFVTSFRNALINHALGGGDRVRAATLYWAAVTTAPAIDGTGAVEAVYVGYARVEKTNNATNFPAAVNGILANGTQIDFPEVPEAHVGTIEVVGFALYEAAAGGTPIAYAASPKSLAALDTLFIAAGGLSMQFNNAA